MSNDETVKVAGTEYAKLVKTVAEYFEIDRRRAAFVIAKMAIELEIEDDRHDDNERITTC